MTGGKEDQIANLKGARASMSIGLYGYALVGAYDIGMSS
jgi:hypothetical protein